jgi:protocatechuate 3,4-dioxygenase beta subunit
MLGTVLLAVLALPAPRPSPTPTPALEISVKGPDGKPVADARLLVVERGSSERPREGRSDPQGAFRLTLSRDVPLDVRVEAPGLAPANLEKVRAGTPLLVALTRGGAIEGSVRDAAGRPVPEARVVAREQLSRQAVDPTLPLVETRSGKDGRFRLEGLPTGRLTVTATARSLGRAELRDLRAGGRADLVLASGAWLAGRVTDGSTRPVAGARVRVAGEDPLPAVPPAAGTDADGRYEISGLAAGIYDVLVSSAGLAPVLVPRVAVQRQAGAGLDVVLEKGSRVEGRVVDADGKPRAAQVWLAELDGRANRALADLVRTEADARGRFGLERLPAGSHALLVRAAGRAAQRVEVSVAADEPLVDLGDVVLETGLALRGRVHDAAGTAIADARVVAVRMVATRFEELETRSAGDGTFAFSGLLNGPHWLRVTAAGFASASRTVPAGRDDVDLTLVPGGSIEGQVVDEADRPVESFRVSATGRSSDHEGRLEANAGDGRFRLDDLAPDSYVVEVSAPERAPGLASNVAVVAGRSRDLGKIRLGAGLTLRGTVVDSAGAGQAGAMVQAVESTGDPQSWNAPGGPSGVGGSFEIKGLAAGTYDVVASHPDFVTGRAQGLDLAAGRPAPEVRVVLTRGGSVEGRAHHRGTPIAGATVQVTGAGQQPFDWLRRVVATTGGDGTFRAERVPAGPVKVQLIQDKTRLLEVDAQVAEGEATAVELALRDVLVHGRVTRGGEPAPGLSMRLLAPDAMGRAPDTPGGAPTYLSAITDGEGNYRLLVPRPGSYTGVFGNLDSPLGERRPLEIADAEDVSLDIDLSAAALSGRVVDKATGRGLPDARLWASPSPPVPGRSGSARSGPDGSFTVRLQPGAYRLSVNCDEHAGWQGDVEAPSVDLRVELETGAVLEGRLVDAGGRGVGGTEIDATPAQGHEAWTTSRPDGSFRFGDLGAMPYALAAATEDGRFAVALAVTPGDSGVNLVLRPGGRVRLRVVDPEGQPIRAAYGNVESLAGVPLQIPFLSSAAQSDASGWMVVPAPAGPVQLGISAKDRENGTLSVQVPEGQEVSAEVTLQPKAPPR